MSVPGLVDHDASPSDNFADYFAGYSVYARDVTVPNHVAVYVADNNEDGDCVAVLTPEPSLGAKRWTINGRWITIGVYRDSGREPGTKPIHDDIRWARVGDQLIVYDSAKHQLILGEDVKHAFTNVGSWTAPVTKIVSDYAFVTTTTPAGSTSGSSEETGAYYQGLRYVNFREENVVFRLLPSFRLVPWSFVRDLFDESAPSPVLSRRSLYEVTSGTMKKVSNQITKSVNYTVPFVRESDITPQLQRRFNQLYDERGRPLTLTYDALGNARPPTNIDSRYKNNPPKKNNTAGYTLNGSPFNPRVYVYDFYGLEINDPNRGPYNDVELITRDLNSSSYVGNIVRKADEFGSVYYRGELYDEFGNVVVGVQSNNAVVTRQNILPLSLDQFNHPVKAPIRRSSDGI